MLPVLCTHTNEVHATLKFLDGSMYYVSLSSSSDEEAAEDVNNADPDEYTSVIENGVSMRFHATISRQGRRVVYLP